jgi:hypothetical protein
MLTKKAHELTEILMWVLVIHNGKIAHYLTYASIDLESCQPSEEQIVSQYHSS